MFRLIFAWNDYFTPTATTTVGPGKFSSTQTLSDTNVYVLNCLCSGCISSSNGGAIYCTSTNLLVESSSFLSCRTGSNNGGAIFFQNTGSGQCVLYGLCGYDCCSTYTGGNSHGQFARIDVYNVASSKNYVNYTSNTRCVNENTNSYDPLCLVYGKILCSSINISMNKCYYRSAIYCYPFTESSSIICSLSYSSFADNVASKHYCIVLNKGDAKYEIKCCNILRNTQVELGSYGTIYTNGNLIIKDSCIFENTANNIFYQGSSSYTITLSNCTVDKATCNQNLNTQNTVTKSFIHGLNHISTQNCPSEYDSAGTLTAIPYFSYPTKKLFCYTMKMCLCQARISDFFSLHCLFIFTFIHPDPYGE
jgi:hypothetical protein